MYTHILALKRVCVCVCVVCGVCVCGVCVWCVCGVCVVCVCVAWFVCVVCIRQLNTCEGIVLIARLRTALSFKSACIDFGHILVIIELQGVQEEWIMTHN